MSKGSRPFRRGGGFRRRDASEPAIIQGLRACGAFVQQLSGDGAPDLLVRCQGRWTPLEVKSDGGHRTKAQEQTQYPLVRSLDEALAACGLARQAWRQEF